MRAKSIAKGGLPIAPRLPRARSPHPATDGAPLPVGPIRGPLRPFPSPTGGCGVSGEFGVEHSVLSRLHEGALSRFQAFPVACLIVCGCAALGNDATWLLVSHPQARGRINA